MRVSHNGISRLVLYHLVLAGWAVSFDGARQQKRVTDALPKRPKLELLNTLFMARYEKHAGGHTLI